MATDTKPTSLTAADLKAIGLRVERDDRDSCGCAIDDRASLYATLERLIERKVGLKYPTTGEKIWHVFGDRHDYLSEDAAIDALLNDRTISKTKRRGYR